MPSKTIQPEDFIEPLNLGGMHGRMLNVPAPRRYRGREILFIYGQHSSLERLWGFVEVLNRYGSVTVPDLPGFGGMDSFYSVNEKPTIDNMADYLATFIRWRYKNKRVIIAGLSYGFIVLTRMLQRYPELAKKVDLLICIVGFAHHDDFSFSRGRMAFFKYGSAFFTLRFPAWIFQHIVLQPLWIRLVYHHLHNAKSKFSDKDSEDFDKAMTAEIKLWRINDVRTQFFCYGEMFRLDNCTSRIDLPLHHVTVNADQYFDDDRAEQHLRVIFGDYHQYRANVETHSVSVVATKEEADVMVPRGLKRVLREGRS